MTKKSTFVLDEFNAMDRYFITYEHKGVKKSDIIAGKNRMLAWEFLKGWHLSDGVLIKFVSIEVYNA